MNLVLAHILERHATLPHRKMAEGFTLHSSQESLSTLLTSFPRCTFLHLSELSRLQHVCFSTPTIRTRTYYGIAKESMKLPMWKAPGMCEPCSSWDMQYAGPWRRSQTSMPCMPARELGAANMQFGGVGTVSGSRRDFSTPLGIIPTLHPWHVKRNLLFH